MAYFRIIEADAKFAPQRAIAKAAGYRAVQSTPLTSRTGNLVGVLSTHFHEPRRFLPWEMKLLDMHARHAGDVIELFKQKKSGRRGAGGERGVGCVVAKRRTADYLWYL
ncbi:MULTISPECIES: GAF domain-containing protein [Calothrix]|uniref:GAF domain-containing protein n=2 Tax=Calothrix TaxID=1186 RepID=A0ABR8AKR0_9CYAN|nr:MULTISPECIES: GAF domain-containing protein [Calothrix]MBD2200652.1 GAF domain-containing protein [Calothrix parietina FACHB-288]MBD2229699.1 GAF domain-containing protein [Calothrix anomala FACHB-343]